MITLGELKKNIMKILCEYSKNGEILTEDIPSIADRNLSMDFYIDVTLRKVMTLCGLENGKTEIHAEQGQNISFLLPEEFAAFVSLYTPSGNVYEGNTYIADSRFCFKAEDDGMYTFVYKRYPEKVSGREDNYALEVDAYIADAVAYGAAAELCDKQEGDLFTRIKYRFDELMANRYNVDKLSAPPFNRVYAVQKRRKNVI